MKIFFTTILLCALVSMFAQTSGGTKEKELKGIVYNNELSFGGGLHTNGFNLSFAKGKIKKYYLTRVLYFELAEVHSPKQVRYNADPQNYRSSYFYGKQNSFFTVRAGWGAKRYFSEKAKEKGLAMGMTYLFGPSLGILKPYYLDIYKQETGQEESMKYSEENAEFFLNISNRSNIMGPSGFGKGWGEIRPLPGGFARVGLLFDIGAFDAFLKDIEVGALLEAYPKKVQMMVSDDNPQVMVNLFLNVHFGKRK